MTIDFYCMDGSPPCAVVSLTMAALGIESEVKYHFLEYFKNDQLKPEFVQINPQHTAPTIIDNGFILCESRSIAKYLVTKYGNTKLYPPELKARALVDQRLDFDLGTLFSRFTEYYYPHFYGKDLDEGKLLQLQDALAVLNAFLDRSKFAAGSDLTLADFSLAVSVSFIKNANISIKEFPNIVRWLELVKSAAPKCEELIEKYTKDFDLIIDNNIEKREK